MRSTYPPYVERMKYLGYPPSFIEDKPKKMFIIDDENIDEVLSVGSDNSYDEINRNDTLLHYITCTCNSKINVKFGLPNCLIHSDVGKYQFEHLLPNENAYLGFSSRRTHERRYQDERNHYRYKDHNSDRSRPSSYGGRDTKTVNFSSERRSNYPDHYLPNHRSRSRSRSRNRY